jgi:hypothetical protein
VRGEPLDLVPQRAAALRVQAGGRLVEEEDRRAVHERERQVEPALHAARVAADLAVGRVGEADALEQLGAAAAPLGLGQPVEPALQLHVLAAGEEVVERGVLQRRADVPAHVGAMARHVEAGHGRAPRGRRQEGGEHVDGRRLARSVGPQEAVDLARGDLEVDAVDGADVAFERPDQALDHDAVMVAAHGPEGARHLEVVNDLCR